MLPYKKENLVPFFQPIIAADTFSIYGYESLGRLVFDGKAVSLGPFFTNPEIPTEELLEVDRVIRAKAIQAFTGVQNGKKLFLNIKPTWIYRFLDCPHKIPTIQLLRESCIPTEDVIIEITEDCFTGELSSLAKLLNYYRKQGCRIAVDDFGSDFSNFERIAYINPDIIKVDIQIVQKSVQMESYYELLNLISSFCQRIGADVLFEGIETFDQLFNCVRSGGRYYQGFVFSQALPHFEYDNGICDILRLAAMEYKNAEIKSMLAKNSICSHLDHIISRYLKKFPFRLERNFIDQYLLDLSRELPQSCIKLFMCDYKGWQVSSNIEKTSAGTFKGIKRYNKSNWSWRSYVLHTAVEIRNSSQGLITEPYRDIVTKEKIYTYSFPIDQDHILFIDVLCHEDGSGNSEFLANYLI